MGTTHRLPPRAPSRNPPPSSSRYSPAERFCSTGNAGDLTVFTTSFDPLSISTIMKLPTTSFHLAALAALLVNPALSATIILEASSARSQNGLYWSSSYFTGMESGIEWRSNFVFDLSTVSATVSSAYLEIDSYDYASSASTETITLFDSSVGFTLPPANVTTFGDLGSGTIYGSLTTSSADANSLLAVLLNPAALSDINSYLGSVFSIGITLSSIDGSLLGLQ